MQYKIQNDHFFRKNSKNILLQEIINTSKNRLRIIHQLYDEIDYKKKHVQTNFESILMK